MRAIGSYITNSHQYRANPVLVAVSIRLMTGKGDISKKVYVHGKECILLTL